MADQEVAPVEAGVATIKEAEEISFPRPLPVPQKIVFDFQYEHGVKGLAMRPPLVRDKLIAQRGADKNTLEIDLDIDFYANLCGVERDILESLMDIDFNKVVKAYQSFLA